MSDCIIKGIALGNEVRFFAAYTTDIAEKARQIHNTSPICTAALGRLLTAGAMMGSMSKNDSDIITLRITGNGPAKGLTVTSDSHANVKGIVYEPIVDLPPNLEGHLNVGDAIGDGILYVIKDIGLKDPYVGQVPLVTSEIAEDLTYYFATSEQIPTSVGLGVLMNHDNTVDKAGGFIIQLMPFASEETIKKIEDGLAGFKSVTSFLSSAFHDRSKSEDEILTDMMRSILGDDVHVEDKMPTEYKCNCSRERVTKALISVGRKEIENMINDGEPINMHCEFCNTDYKFSIEELKELLA